MKSGIVHEKANFIVSDLVSRSDDYDNDANLRSLQLCACAGFHGCANGRRVSDRSQHLWICFDRPGCHRGGRGHQSNHPGWQQALLGLGLFLLLCCSKATFLWLSHPSLHTKKSHFVSALRHRTWLPSSWRATEPPCFTMAFTSLQRPWKG